MSDYRKVAYGYVDSRLLDPTVSTINGILRAYVVSSQDMEMMIDPASIAEVVSLGEKITGGDFKHWLMANYDNGVGKRAKLVRAIVGYLNGDISGRTMSQSITADEQYVTTTQLKLVAGAYNGRIDRRDFDEVQRKLDKLDHNDMHRFIEGVGPQLFARMLITFNGESAYGRK